MTAITEGGIIVPSEPPAQIVPAIRPNRPVAKPIIRYSSANAPTIRERVAPSVFRIIAS